jgi:cysteine desulfurase/selenocysteine lyase
MEMALDKVRSHFPVLDRKVYGKDLVYLDNAATMQRPVEVIDLWNKISSESNANIHRAVHILADEATTAYEAAREEVRRFIGASSREEVILTAGTTASINLVASSFGEAFVKEGDEIIVSQAEHHSNIVPWQLMCARKGAELKVIPINDKGHLDLSVLDSLLSPKTRLVAVSHISNVLGIINPVKTIIEKCHSKGIPVLIDGAQGIVHTKVDMKELDCDFYVFSGHKIFAATGTGVLYGRKELLEAMPPYMGGGEMVGTVRFTGTSYAPLPMKFEAGTPNFASVATLKPALEFARSLDVEEVKKNEEAVRDFMLDALMADGQIRLFGVPDGDRAVKIPLFSFCVDGVHHEDLALILDKMGIAVRSGQMCAEPLMDRFGVTGMLRASFAPYNTLQEAEYFIKSLHRAINMLR